MQIRPKRRARFGGGLIYCAAEAIRGTAVPDPSYLTAVMIRRPGFDPLRGLLRTEVFFQESMTSADGQPEFLIPILDSASIWFTRLLCASVPLW